MSPLLTPEHTNSLTPSQPNNRTTVHNNSRTPVQPNVRTTVILPQALHESLRLEAVRQRITFSQLVVLYILASRPIKLPTEETTHGN